jgi:hypothetical protein
MRKDKELGLLEHWTQSLWGMGVRIFLCSVTANILKSSNLPSSESYYFA